MLPCSTAMTPKTLDLAQISNRRQAMKVLKDLGFTEPGYIMTRGTKLLTGYDLSVTLAPENFMVLDNRDGELSFVPMLADDPAMTKMFEQLVTKQLVPAGTKSLPLMGLAVGIAMLGVKRQAPTA